MQLKQISGLGPVAVRKLVAAGVRSIEMLEVTEPHRIEMILSRNPPLGNQVLAAVKEFPKLTVSAVMTGKVTATISPERFIAHLVIGCKAW